MHAGVNLKKTRKKCKPERLFLDYVAVDSQKMTKMIAKIRFVNGQTVCRSNRRKGNAPKLVFVNRE